MKLEKYNDKVLKVYGDKDIGFNSDSGLDFGGGADTILDIVEKARHDKDLDLCEFLVWCDELKENGVL